ncbi:hypothetical protein C8Q76DRAFT_460269 [Earliella scabrosa]|nr:hypothetical protein C8Q76DRAFT_460269 [Earliella scabrosa]
MASYTPSDAIDPSKERDWPAQLGMLDWDSTSIVFTKRSLLEFLKYAGVTVDPNFTNIGKLPRYAKFGKLSGDTSVAKDSGSAGSSAASASAPAADFKPTRRVREPPGGAHANIFQHDVDDDALAGAPPKEPAPAEATASPSSPPDAEANEESQMPQSKSRGGVAGLWDEPDKPAFKPTRRVREIPGGKDSISGLF